MPKLPHMPRRPCPETDKIYLATWLAEWNIAQKVNEVMPIDPMIHTGEFNPDLPHDPDITPYDNNVKVGDVRCMSPRLFVESNRPLYAVILRDWDGDGFVVAPFGEYYSVPATGTELLTGRDEPLRVLQLWNLRTLSRKFLEYSWLEDHPFSEEELSDAWEVTRHAMTGVPISDKVRGKVGPHIVHPRDPRLTYQNEEKRLFTPRPWKKDKAHLAVC